LQSQIKGKNQFICAGKQLLKMISLLNYCVGSLFTVDDRYDFIKRIGYGAYGVVCSAVDK